MKSVVAGSPLDSDVVLDKSTQQLQSLTQYKEGGDVEKDEVITKILRESQDMHDDVIHQMQALVSILEPYDKDGRWASVIKVGVRDSLAALS